jgi:hypothetical protein
LASEGSFGAHPNLFFVPADDEIMVLIDKQNGFEISARVMSTNTNYSSAVVSVYQELVDFANRTGFPSHALILHAETNKNKIHKGINTWETLKAAFDDLLRDNQRVQVSTDMRACNNPSRMQVITETAQQLVSRVQGLCPKCSAPGFGVTELRKGLPCTACKSPTRTVIASLSTCQACGHKHELNYPGGYEMEDPMYCDVCNP